MSKTTPICTPPLGHYNYYDLTNNGKADWVCHGNRPGSAVSGYSFQPYVHTHDEFLPFQAAPQKLTGLWNWQYSFTDKTHKDVRFYAAQGPASFVVGQKAGWSDDTGKFKVIHIDGIVIAFRPGSGGKAIPQSGAKNRVGHWAYQKVGNQIDSQVSTNDLTWVVKVGNHYERLDPNLQKHQGSLTDSEKLLVQLFKQAKALQSSPKSEPEKITQLHSIAKAWKKAHAHNGRAHEMMKPILWNGILGAMAKLAGLSPADFSE